MLIADERILAAWDPAARPVHCANCLHAKVSGPPAAPVARCAQGHANGRTLKLFKLCRRERPTAFRVAAQCSDFTSMDDDG